MASDKSTSLDLALCRKCAGRCCQASPGVWAEPERFFEIFFAGQHLTLEQLRKKLLELGLVLWEKSGVPLPAPRSLKTGCVFRSEAGCFLTVKERPCQCLALIPNAETLAQAEGCLCRLPQAFSREQAIEHWREYWPSQELQESIEQPARFRAHSGLF